MGRWLCLLLLLSTSLPAKAEYRVFLLRISKITEAGETDVRLVQSNLDPLQYRYYYPLAADETIVYTDTWRCYGRTDQFKSFCPNPKGQNEDLEQSEP